MWTIIWNAAYTRLKVLKWKRRKDNKQPTVENTQPRDGSAEEADNLASARGTATMQNHTAVRNTQGMSHIRMIASMIGLQGIYNSGVVKWKFSSLLSAYFQRPFVHRKWRKCAYQFL